MNMAHLRERSLEPSFGNYEAVYAGQLPDGGNTAEKLDALYTQFNTNHPKDFAGHSLSVSDIVVVKQNGVVSYHYVDSIGFTAIPAFLPENYLKNAEMFLEDDYGMIDGIINNGPKEQPEAKPKAPDLSALFAEARRTVQEEQPTCGERQKPSVMAKLRAPTPPRNEKTAQAKSAERDLL